MKKWNVERLIDSWWNITYKTFIFSGGYYNIELAGRNLRLISLNMNIYLEDIAEEVSSTNPHHQRHMRRRKLPSGIRTTADRLLPGQAAVKAEPGSTEFLATGPSSSWVSDPEDQWAWLYRVMEEAKRKKQNVSYYSYT